jgi:hypothetical protein
LTVARLQPSYGLAAMPQFDAAAEPNDQHLASDIMHSTEMHRQNDYFLLLSQ